VFFLLIEFLNIKMMIINSTLNNLNNDFYYYSDHFPLPYEDDDLINGTYYDDYLLNNNETFNLTNSDLISSSIFSFSSPFSYIFLILIVYLILTVILLSFSIYKQRQSDIENFYFGDTEEDIKQAKHRLIWKQLLINRIRKGDMEPLLIETYNNSNDINSLSKKSTFPIHIV
jgi:hypothetical protein